MGKCDSSAFEFSIEDLVKSLQEANDEILMLRARLDEYAWLDRAVRRRTNALSERVKELNCLIAVSRCFTDSTSAPETILQRMIQIVPSGYSHPRRTWARLELRGQMFQSNEFRQTPYRQESTIRAAGKNIGNIQVCVDTTCGDEGEEPFLHEEQSLLDAIAFWIGDILVQRIWR